MITRLKNYVLWHCPKREEYLDRLLLAFPPLKMSRAEADAKPDLLGYCTTTDFRIVLRDAGNARALLHTYLHEVAHALVMCAGHNPPGKPHDRVFARFCNELHVDFDVFNGEIDHNFLYEQQDADELLLPAQARHNAKTWGGDIFTRAASLKGMLKANVRRAEEQSRQARGRRSTWRVLGFTVAAVVSTAIFCCTIILHNYA